VAMLNSSPILKALSPSSYPEVPRLPSSAAPPEIASTQRVTRYPTGAATMLVPFDMSVQTGLSISGFTTFLAIKYSEREGSAT